MSTPENSPQNNPGRRNLLLVAAIATAGVVIAVGAAIFLLGGDDEAEAKGSCQGASYELNAEREEGDRMTGSLEIKAAASGEQWDVTITADGKDVVDETRTSDAEAELDVDAFLGTGDERTEVVASFGKAGAERCTAKVTLG